MAETTTAGIPPAFDQANGAEPPLSPQARPTAIERRPIPLRPTTIDDLWRIADSLSRATNIPDKLRRQPYDVFVILLNAMELGIGLGSALRNIHVVEGKPILSADLMLGMLFRSDALEYFKLMENTEQRCKMVAKRKGNFDPVTVIWTIEDAQRAGLTEKRGPGGGPGTWVKYPKEMLYARAGGQMAHRIAPELFSGVQTREEWEDALEVNPAPTVGVTAPARPGSQGDQTVHTQTASPALAEPSPKEHLEPAKEAVPVEQKPQERAEPAAQSAGEPGEEDKLSIELDEAKDAASAPSAERLTEWHKRIHALPQSNVRKELEQKYANLRKWHLLGKGQPK